MNDFNKHIRPLKEEEKNNSKIENIRDNYDYENNHNNHSEEKENSKNFLLTQMHAIKNFFSNILKKATSDPKEESRQRKTLKKLKKALLELSQESRGKHQEISLALSDAWKELIDDHENLDHHKIQLLIDAFKTYPGRNDHSLHFYLTRYSKSDWFPIPFFQILSDLQKEYLMQMKNSHLDRWLNLIDEIILEI